MDALKTKVNSLKAMMKTFGINLSDIVNNEELVGLLKARLLNGEVSKQDIQNLVNGIAENNPVERSATTDKAASPESLRFAKHGTTGLCYALCGGKVIGPVIEARGLKFVLDLKNCATNLTINEAKEEAEQKEDVGGISWIIPSDDHFYALQATGTARVNAFLVAYDGDRIDSTPFLSTTSQANRPSKWNVRLVLPLPK